jgi:hypothetical protein
MFGSLEKSSYLCNIKDKDMTKIGNIVSYISQNPDGLRDQVYVKCVENKRNSCKGCYLYGRLILSQRKEFCAKNCGKNIMFEFNKIKNM